jgi:oxygen-dependent protoporphyrinogen oxidase
MARVVVIGGGIGGLATAYALRKRAPSLDITVLERSARLGGNIVTEERDGFVIDGGPDSWVASKPQASALAKAVGLEADIVPTIEATRRVYIAFGGKLHRIPEGLVLGIPTRIRPVLETPLFSFAGKARMGLEPFIPTKDWSGDADESIGDFVTRRLGAEVTDRLAAPLLGGIFAGDAHELSVRATFPQFVEAETKHGSLVRAMRAARKPSAGGVPPSAFLSLRRGMGTLVTAVVEGLSGVSLRTGADVRALSREGGGVRVVLGTGEVVPADQVVLALPGHGASQLLEGISKEISEQLGKLAYVSTATAFLAFRREDVRHPLDAVGFLVPRTLRRPVLAATWVSSKWAGRAPEGYVLMRAFFGGAWGEEVLQHTDDELAELAEREIGAFMPLVGKPLFTRVFRFHRSNPQPKVGHLVTMARIRASLAAFPELQLVGSGYDGVGIPDGIRQAEAAADAVVRGLK